MGNDVFGRGKIVFVTPSFPTMRQLVRENSGVFMRGVFRLILVAFDRDVCFPCYEMWIRRKKMRILIPEGCLW